MHRPTYGIYAATNAAVEAMTHILARALSSRGITVNAIAPDPIDPRLIPVDEERATADNFKRMHPVGRLGEVEDIARVVSLLVASDSDLINGHVVRANVAAI